MLCQAGQRLSFDYSTVDFQSGLSIRADIRDVTAGLPGTLAAQVVMGETEFGRYVGQFVPVAGKSYVIYKKVYTDNTYTTEDTNRGPATEEKECVDFQSFGQAAPPVAAALAMEITIDPQIIPKGD